MKENKTSRSRITAYWTTTIILCLSIGIDGSFQLVQSKAVVEGFALIGYQLVQHQLHFLNLSAQGNEFTSYHLEARIAFQHCMKKDTKEKWEEILQLYNQLLMINYSPSVALNRTYVLYKANGKEAALIEAEKLKLETNHFYFLLLGELYKNIDNQKAKLNFQKAFSLAKTQTEKQNIQKKIKQLS